MMNMMMVRSHGCGGRGGLVEGGELGVGVEVSGMEKKKKSGERREGEIILLFTVGPTSSKIIKVQSRETLL